MDVTVFEAEPAKGSRLMTASVCSVSVSLEGVLVLFVLSSLLLFSN